MTEEEFEECEQAERQKHDEKVRELEKETTFENIVQNVLKEGFTKENSELKHQLTHRNCIDCSNHSSKLKMRVLELEKENAELKAKTQWHKLADGELPKENKLYLVALKDNGLAIAYFNGRHWETRYNLGDFGHCVETVIAWRELPTFEE